jgi:hypothetical protein
VTTARDSDIRTRNHMMLEKIRSGTIKPYEEGHYALRVLAIAGRLSGQPRLVPIAVVQVDGSIYVCSPDRKRDWVRNLMAAGSCRLEGDTAPAHQATLIENARAARVVNRYLTALGRMSNQWPFPSDATPEVIQHHIGEIAVFQLDTLTALD